MKVYCAFVYKYIENFKGKAMVNTDLPFLNLHFVIAKS